MNLSQTLTGGTISRPRSLAFLLVRLVVVPYAIPLRKRRLRKRTTTHSSILRRKVTLLLPQLAATSSKRRTRRGMTGRISFPSLAGRLSYDSAHCGGRGTWTECGFPARSRSQGQDRRRRRRLAAANSLSWHGALSRCRRGRDGRCGRELGRGIIGS
jgi:hypothetical protein